MRRRLEIARAVLHTPQVLFLDEPTLGLDPQARIHIWDYIKRLRNEYGTAVFLITHYMEEAEMLCDRVAIIDHGKIIALGSPEELKSMIGNDVIYIKIDDLNQDTCSRLSIDGVQSCKVIDSETMVVQVRKASEAIPEVLRYLEKSEVKVKEVSYRRPSLNDVFIHSTGRGIRDSEGEFVDAVRMRRRARMR